MRLFNLLLVFFATSWMFLAAEATIKGTSFVVTVPPLPKFIKSVKKFSKRMKIRVCIFLFYFSFSILVAFSKSNWVITRLILIG